MRKNWWKIAVVVVVIAAVAVTVLAKNRNADGGSSTAIGADETSGVQANLPKLVDLGADKCIPCKQMAPILRNLRKEYKGKLIVEFIDVWKNPGAGDKYGISTIPTQVFYDANGKEFSRHTGFMPKEDILATFEDHGIKLKK